MSFNVQLHFEHTNEFGTDIYRDPLHRYAFKTAEHVTPFELNPMVNYQGDLYIGKDGARYDVTRHPDRIDPYGGIRSKNTIPVDSLPNRGESLANTSRPIPDEARTQKASLLGKLFDNFHVNEDEFSPLWTPVRNMKVFRVSQDDPLQEVFRDASGVFYATTKLLHLQFVAQQALRMEQSRFDMQIRDTNANEY